MTKYAAFVSVAVSRVALLKITSQTAVQKKSFYSTAHCVL
jgi:hypothetical protein